VALGAEAPNACSERRGGARRCGTAAFVRRRARAARARLAKVEIRGEGSFERRIDPILMGDEAAYGLLACEVLTSRA
jgi:5-deoxy-D-glucuronate isomerase